MMVRAIGRYSFVLWTAARQQWVYRAEMALRSISTVIFMGTFVALWAAAFGVSGQAELAGYSLAEMVWYLAMTESIALSASRIFIEISEAVRAGDLAYTLARPTSYPLLQVATSLGQSLPRFFLNLAVAAGVVALSLRQLVGSPAGLGAFLLTAAFALLLDALIAVLIGLLAFWLEEVTPVFWIYHKLLFTVGGLFLPLEMFPTWLRRIVRWLPFQFITYVPARSFVAFQPGAFAHAVGGQLAYIVGLSALIALVWSRARRRLVVHGG